MGEPDEVQRARDQLVTLDGEEGRQAESQVFAYLPKVTGETRTLLVDLVTERGAVEQARHLLGSLSAVRRCRGAYRLGAMHRTDAVPLLVPLLHDRTFLVRRVALRALGAIGDPTAVVPILRHCAGTTGSPATSSPRSSASGRRERRRCAPSWPRAWPAPRAAGGPPSSPPSASAWSVTSVRSTCSSRRSAPRAPRCRQAAAEALGRIGAPSAIPALVAALDVPDELVRRAAAGALGDIGDPSAAEGLGHALVTAPRITSRTLASALLQLGDPGMTMLQEHGSPYAAEALAVHALRGRV